jgi:hypothetical protein
MRALRVVGYEEDGAGQPRVILEDPERRERYSVPADERLRAAARGDVQRLGQMSMDLESQLRPREIQARIRAGASVEQVAAAAGVTEERIERFAYPVLLERSRIAELARAAHPLREDGPDVRTLTEVVEQTFTLRGQDFSDAEWDAWRGEDNKWVVALSWKVGRSDIAARWGYHPGAHGGTVGALDEHATDLIDGQLSRPPRRVGPVIDFSKPDIPSTEAEPAEPAALESSAPAPSAGGGRTGGGPERATGTDQATGSGRGGAGRSGGSGRNSGAPADPGAGRRATKTTTGSAARARSTAAGTDPAGRSSADEPSGGSEQGGSAAKRGGRKAKPVMPSWEDVLLGVKRN